MIQEVQVLRSKYGYLTANYPEHAEWLGHQADVMWNLYTLILHADQGEIEMSSEHRADTLQMIQTHLSYVAEDLLRRTGAGDDPQLMEIVREANRGGSVDTGAQEQVRFEERENSKGDAYSYGWAMFENGEPRDAVREIFTQPLIEDALEGYDNATQMAEQETN